MRQWTVNELRRAGATCTTCCLIYSLERLREKLSLQSVQPQETCVPEPIPEAPTQPKVVKPKIVKPRVVKAKVNEPVPVVADTVIMELTQESAPLEIAEEIVGKSEPVEPVLVELIKQVEEPVPQASFDFKPEQFVFEKTGCGNDLISGVVKQGCIGPGEPVCFDGDERNLYKVSCVKTDAGTDFAREGMRAELYLHRCPRKALKNAVKVTGISDPQPNAYNYPGTVWEYFFNLLKGSFGNCELVINVPYRGINIPVNFLLLRGGKPAAAVFLFKSSDSRSRYQAQKAADVLASEGIGCTHFYEDYRNSMPYVLQRVGGAWEER